MKKEISRALGAGIVVAAIGVNAALAGETVGQPSDGACLQIERALHDWVRAYNSGDLEGVMAVWADDVEGWYPGLDVNGLSATRAQYAPIIEPGFATKIALNIVEISVSDSHAYVRDIWTTSSSDKVETYKSFEIWKADVDGRWRITRWISFPVPPDDNVAMKKSDCSAHNQ